MQALILLLVYLRVLIANKLSMTTVPDAHTEECQAQKRDKDSCLRFHAGMENSNSGLEQSYSCYQAKNKIKKQTSNTDY